jgi:hypothetical protein
MSSALTGNKIKDSYQALLKMGTNGSLDPITPIVISDGLGNDTPILLSRTEFKTQVVSTAKFYGFWADLSSNSHVAVGDYAGQYNGTQLYVNDYARLIQTYGGANKGFKLDFANNLYLFGDYNNAVNGVRLDIDVSNQNILTKGNNGILKGISLEFSINNYRFGDYDYADNGTFIGVDDNNQQITTYNNGGGKGFSLDFANNQYRFGDFNGLAIGGDLIIIDGASELKSVDNYLGLYGPSLNTWLGYYPGSIRLNNFSANSNNYVFGSDWQMENDDDVKYPFKYNTVLNCYNNNLDTSDIAMFYNLIANVQDPGFYVNHDINYLDSRSISNCFIFGLTDTIGSSTLNIRSQNFNPTNVVILNGSDLYYGKNTSNVFSVNASSVSFDNENISGINILGGDFNWKDSIYPANHRVLGFDRYGINIQGRKALAQNSFTKVTSEWFRQYDTSQGQVQIEEKLLFQYYPDGSVYIPLFDTFENSNINLQPGSTYRVNAKILSTTGDGDFNIDGNSSIDATWIVCLDNSGTITVSDYCEGCSFNPHSATQYYLTDSSATTIQLYVKPEAFHNTECWVQAYVTLQCITNQ